MKNKNLLISFKHAFVGIFSAFKTEKNLKIHSLATILVILLGIYFKITKLEWLACILTISQVIVSELINTAIEESVNLASPGYNETAKIAKDVAAGAVLFAALISIIVGIIIFLPYILKLF